MNLPSVVAAIPVLFLAVACTAAARELDNCFLVTGSIDKGSACIVTMDGAPWFLSNAATFSGNGELQIKGALADKPVPVPGAFEAAENADLIRAKAPADQSGFALLEDVDGNLKLGDVVIAYGNLGGRGFLTRREGKVTGLTNDRVQTSLTLYGTDDGCAVIQEKSGKLIGIVSSFQPRNAEDLASFDAFSGKRYNEKEEAAGFVVRVDHAAGWKLMDPGRALKERKAVDAMFQTGNLLAKIGSEMDPGKHPVTLDGRPGGFVERLADDVAIAAKTNPVIARIETALRDWRRNTGSRKNEGDILNARRSFLNFMTTYCKSDIEAFKPGNFSYGQRIRFEEEVRMRSKLTELFRKAADAKPPER